MASTIQKILRKSPPPRIFTDLYPKRVPNLNVPLTFQQPHCNEIKPDPFLGHNPIQIPFLGARETDNLSPFSHIYPSFPFGFCLNPLPLSGSIPSEAGDVSMDDSTKVWADSVKKKRKKKMNKHKYQKLRKRLRRQT
ncbi:hypothetical protein TorRG33x02_325960 [Trema orientale]|uniref:Small ribosomal subunit protein mS38 n=1 Tax=Trema orientale TaxID=63057 RepID=A0A2P5BCE5_TREOI|nr:hypothetical protein TorRG33x02_325960 [Trema orientale]